MITKEILKEEIIKTKETLITIKKLMEDSRKKGEEIEKNCLVGIDMNNFVLGKLEEEFKLL